MGDHHAALGACGPTIVRQDAGDVFVGQAVEPVAPNSLFCQAARQSKGGGDFRLGVVEGSVEAGDLRQARVQFRKRRDGGEVMRLMERGERDEPGRVRR